MDEWCQEASDFWVILVNVRGTQAELEGDILAEIFEQVSFLDEEVQLDWHSSRLVVQEISFDLGENVFDLTEDLTLNFKNPITNILCQAMWQINSECGLQMSEIVPVEKLISLKNMVLFLHYLFLPDQLSAIYI